MLGLSATMNRKDGTTKVFKMFLGDVIFKGKRDEAREQRAQAQQMQQNLVMAQQAGDAAQSLNKSQQPNA